MVVASACVMNGNILSDEKSTCLVVKKAQESLSDLSV